MDSIEEIRARRAGHIYEDEIAEKDIDLLLAEIDRLKAEAHHMPPSDHWRGKCGHEWRKTQSEDCPICEVAGLKAENERLRVDLSSAQFDLCEHEWTWQKPDQVFLQPWQHCARCGGSKTGGEQQDQEP